MTAEAQTVPETDDADRRAKGVMAHHLEYGPLAMQRTIAEALRSAVKAEREACAQIGDLWAETKPSSGIAAPLISTSMGHAAKNIAAAIRARGEAG